MASWKICNLNRRSCSVFSEVWGPGLGQVSVPPFLCCYADVISVTNGLLSALVAINQLQIRQSGKCRFSKEQQSNGALFLSASTSSVLFSERKAAILTSNAGWLGLQEPTPRWKFPRSKPCQIMPHQHNSKLYHRKFSLRWGYCLLFHSLQAAFVSLWHWTRKNFDFPTSLISKGFSWSLHTFLGLCLSLTSNDALCAMIGTLVKSKELRIQREESESAAPPCSLSTPYQGLIPAAQWRMQHQWLQWFYTSLVHISYLSSGSFMPRSLDLFWN